MKIIRLCAENIKKLTVVEICPEGNVVQITGKNASGKTSVLDSLWWVFTGTANIQGQPIRQGETSARIEVQLGDAGKVALIAERTFTPTNSYLSIKTADGAKYPKPQEFMNDLLGSLTLDPLAFMRQKSADQFETLRGLVTLDVDLEEIDAENRADFAKRTELNRDAKAARAQASAIKVPEGTPELMIVEADLLDKITTAADANADIERRKANRANAFKQIETNKGTVAKLRSDSEKLLADAAALQKASDGLEAQLKDAGDLPALVDISAVRAELEAAKVTNASVALRGRLDALTAEAKTLEDKADALTGTMEGRNAMKLAAIAKAAMPVPGLSFGDGVVTFNGVPLDQASDAEQLTVSMCIAAAFNPKLRVLRIRDGSLLDDDAMKRLATFAEDRDMQVWIERVDGSGTVGFVMEDGHVRGQEIAQDDKPSAKKKGAVAA